MSVATINVTINNITINPYNKYGTAVINLLSVKIIIVATNQLIPTHNNCLPAFE
jgi:hypothetical protein